MSEELKKAIKHTLDKNFEEGESVIYTWNGSTGKGIVKGFDEIRRNGMKVISTLILPDGTDIPVRMPASAVFHAE